MLFRQLGNLPHGFDHKYIYSHIGYNLKLTDMQAAIGLAQLEKLDQFIQQRKDNFNFLYENLQPYNMFLALPEPAENSDPSWFGFPIRVKKNSPIGRNKIIQFLNDKNIGTRLLFGGNLINQPAYIDVLNNKNNFINAKIIMHDVFWIGVQPNLNKVKLDYIIKVIKNIFSEK